MILLLNIFPLCRCFVFFLRLNCIPGMVTSYRIAFSGAVKNIVGVLQMPSPYIFLYYTEVLVLA